MVSVTVTQPLDIAINSAEPVVDLFLQKFQNNFITKLRNYAGKFDATAYSFDPAQ